MTTTTMSTDYKTGPGEADSVADGGSEGSVVVPDEVIDQIMSTVDATDGQIELLGEDGVIAQLTKRLLERGLQAELAEELGYEPGDPAGRGSGNNRNGTFSKTVLTEVGEVELDIPRDRNGDFEPKLVPNGTTRLAKFNENIVLNRPGSDGDSVVWVSSPAATRPVRAWWLMGRRLARGSCCGRASVGKNAHQHMLTGRWR